MEELQDAIEDAQYMTAMHDGIPRPTKGWKWPSEGELMIRNDDTLQDQRENQVFHLLVMLLVCEMAQAVKSAADILFFL